VRQHSQCLGNGLGKIYFYLINKEKVRVCETIENLIWMSISKKIIFLSKVTSQQLKKVWDFNLVGFFQLHSTEKKPHAKNRNFARLLPFWNWSFLITELLTVTMPSMNTVMVSCPFWIDCIHYRRAHLLFILLFVAQPCVMYNDQ
jgi:hypothetical protein